MKILGPAVVLALAAAGPGWAAQPICYKTTSMMWDEEAGRAILASPEILERVRRAFALWEEASQGALTFRFAGHDAEGYDSTAQIPFDGCVHAVLYGERNFHGELAHGGFNGTIPGDYKRGYFFVSRLSGASSLETIVHEVGHTLGLGHAAVPESIMYSGPRIVGDLSNLSGQDSADLLLKWTPGAYGIYAISGKIETLRPHAYAAVFAESTSGGPTYSARSDHQGRFVLAVAAAGHYRLVARPVDVARDLTAEAKGGMRESWYVGPGVSSSAWRVAAVLAVSDAEPRLSGLRFKTLDDRPAAALKPAALRPSPAPTIAPGFDSGQPPVVRLSFDHGFDDDGPLKLAAKASGDEVQLLPGVAGRALFVGGTEDWLDVELSTHVNIESGFTLELWFRRADWTNPYSGGSGWQTIASVTTGASLAITAPGCPLHKPWALEASVSRYRKDVGESEMARAFSKGDTVPAGQWLHGAMVYDSDAQTLSVYLNGVLADRAKGAPVPDTQIRHIRLGTWHKANQAFRGEIDEVKIYGYPRPAEAIARAAGY